MWPEDFYSNTNTLKNLTPEAKGVVAINMEELLMIQLLLTQTPSNLNNL